MVRMLWTILIAAGVTFSAAAIAAEHPRQCKGSPRVVGACFKVHGRFTEANGIPYRLWWIGTHRVLAPDDVPSTVAKLLDLGWKRRQPMSIRVFGDYEVCPLEKPRPGRMQAVCIESASHLVAVDWDGTLVRP